MTSHGDLAMCGLGTRLIVPVTINGMGISREAIGATMFSSSVSSVTMVNLFAPRLAGIVGLFI